MMIHITLVTTQGCTHCEDAKRLLNKLKSEYALQINEIDAISDKGQDLIKKHGILASPGIIINDIFFAMGGTTEEKLRKKFNQLKNNKKGK